MSLPGRLGRITRDLTSNTRGNVALITGLALAAIVAIGGAVLDLSSQLNARQSAQDAMDTAVLAGAAASASNAQTVANAAFYENISPQITVSTPQYSSASSSSSGKTISTFTGTTTGQIPAEFARLFGVSNLAINVTSTAVTTQGASPCIYVLDPSSSQSLLVNSGANVQAPNCQIDVASAGNPAAIFNSGSTLNFDQVCVQGTQVIQNSTTVPNLKTGCATSADPYAGTLPTPSSSSCTYSNLNYSTALVALSPGVYCGWFNFNNSSSTVTFAPGVYVIKGGGWNVNGGTWSGSGVTFYFADTSKIQFNSGISATLSAPTSGTYANLLFYEASGLAKSAFIFNDSVANKLTGIIYLPSRNVTFNAKSGVSSDSLTLVVWQLILNNTTWTLGPLGGSSGSKSIRLLH